jgi:4-hydroxy-tetrahydrodipicolinate synthase
VFEGCTTALVTPFKGKALDLPGFRRNVRFQVKSGVCGVLVAGSTGESSALTDDEKTRLLRAALDEVKGRVKVLAGVGTNETTRSVRAARAAERAGADGLLVVAPYYNKPTQEGLYRHFRAIADAVKLPIVVYNIPGRCGVNILPATLERLAADCVNVVAVKEASGSLDQMTEIVARCGDRLTLLSGDDGLTLPILAIGGKGVISVASNILPADIVRLVEHYLAGEVVPAAALNARLHPVFKALFVETNPIPVKAAMALLGMAAGAPRMPLTPAIDDTVARLRSALTAFGLKPSR